MWLLQSPKGPYSLKCTDPSFRGVSLGAKPGICSVHFQAAPAIPSAGSSLGFWNREQILPNLSSGWVPKFFKFPFFEKLGEAFNSSVLIWVILPQTSTWTGVQGVYLESDLRKQEWWSKQREWHRAGGKSQGTIGLFTAVGDWGLTPLDIFWKAR